MHPAGCTHNDLNTFRQLSEITFYIPSSNTHGAFDLHVSSNGDDHFLDLQGQLARRREDKHLGLADGHIQLKSAEIK
jgi:hypothetical protein